MQTVIFACPQCGKEMSVAAEFLGLEVRCPHCQQAVPAPTTVPAAVPAVEAAPPETTEPRSSDSIFDAPLDEGESSSAQQSANSTTVFLSSEGDTASGGVAPRKYDDPTTEFLVPDRARTDVFAPAADTAPTDEYVPGAAETPVKRGRAVAGYLLVILIPYAILMTIAAIWFYFKAQQAIHPLEMLPDWPRDIERPARPGDTFQRVDDSGRLPAQLRVGLGQTIRVGDLEVTPQRVERRPLIFSYERGFRKDEPSRHAALVLTLHVRNCSTNTAFAPNDLFFNRKWRDGMPAANRPYTCLEIGPTRFYGGPCDWKPRTEAENTSREFVLGSEYSKELQPGAETSYIVCTDPENGGVLSAAEQAGGPMIWRVQVRRGLVRVRDREASATAVVGVEFMFADVLKANG